MWWTLSDELAKANFHSLWFHPVEVFMSDKMTQLEILWCLWSWFSRIVSCRVKTEFMFEIDSDL